MKKTYVCPKSRTLAINVENVLQICSRWYGDPSDYGSGGNPPIMGQDAKRFSELN